MPETVVFRGVMYFEYEEQGWSESYWLGTGAVNTLKGTLAQLYLNRLSTLPVEATGLYARLTQAGRPRDKHAIDGPYPSAAGLPPLTPPLSGFTNDVEFAQVVGFETADGRWTTYFLRCLPDEQVEDRKMKDDLIIPPPGQPPIAATTWVGRLGNYIELLRKSTFHVRELAPTAANPPVRQWEVTPWALAFDRALAKKNTGRPFGLSRGRAKVR